MKFKGIRPSPRVPVALGLAPATSAFTTKAETDIGSVVHPTGAQDLRVEVPGRPMIVKNEAQRTVRFGSFNALTCGTCEANQRPPRLERLRAAAP
jgi:hypothetical protein